MIAARLTCVLGGSLHERLAQRPACMLLHRLCCVDPGLIQRRPTAQNITSDAATTRYNMESLKCPVHCVSPENAQRAAAGVMRVQKFTLDGYSDRHAAAYHFAAMTRLLLDRRVNGRQRLTAVSS